MSIKDTVKHLKQLLHSVTTDLTKSENGNKAASQRVRTGTIRLEKMAKLYRKESIKAERSGGMKKTKSKPAPKSSKSGSKAPSKSNKSAKSAKNSKNTSKPAKKAASSKSTSTKGKAPMKKRATAKILKKK